MSLSLPISVFAECLLVSMLLPTAVAAEPPAAVRDDAAVLKRILASWQAREAKFKSFYFAWDYHSTPATAAGVKLASRADFWMQGVDHFYLRKVFETSGSAHMAKEPVSADHVWAYAFDGSTSRELTAAADFAIGIIDRGTDERRFDRGSHYPLFLALRPYTRGGHRIAPLRWRVVTQNARLNGTR